jgi:hypothetical protein
MRTVSADERYRRLDDPRRIDALRAELPDGGTATHHHMDEIALSRSVGALPEGLPTARCVRNGIET